MVDLDIAEAAFKIAGGIFLFLIALDMLAAKNQVRKRAGSTGNAYLTVTLPVKVTVTAKDVVKVTTTMWPSIR